MAHAYPQAERMAYVAQCVPRRRDRVVDKTMFEIYVAYAGTQHHDIVLNLGVAVVVKYGFPPDVDNVRFAEKAMSTDVHA